MTHRPPPTAAAAIADPLQDDASAYDDNSSSCRSCDSAASSSITDGRWILRGVQWRIRLGVLPSSPASIDTLRRVSADGRRRYADLRRRLLVDPHIIEEGHRPAHVNMDNPLSLDPESVWGRYFRNAELERTIDKDLTRLYPEHGSFFQGATCQAMLRRILLVWSLMHPQYSYRQGMHELLAPLLYVLHVDVVHLAQVKHRYEDLFDDRFDDLPIHEGSIAHKDNTGRQITYSELLFAKSLGVPDHDGHWVGRISAQDVLGALCQADESDTDLKAIVLGSDLYGAEGELGALLSARFVEHDAYCMFDALLSGLGGAVAMADFFSTTSGTSPASGIPPVLEASAVVYRALAVVDPPLYSHLVEFGVEPQFFALRWLRLLFGREFLLEDLLLVWDAIFSASNLPLSSEGDEDDNSQDVKYSARSALISALAVSMLLYMRPALLAAPDATGCLQRLLSFPKISDVRHLIDSAKLLQPAALCAARTPPPQIAKGSRTFEHSRAAIHKRTGSVSPPLGHGHISTLKNHGLRHQRATTCSPELLRMSIPESYWEEKWTSSVLQKVEGALCSRGPGSPVRETSAVRVPESGTRPANVCEGQDAVTDGQGRSRNNHSASDCSPSPPILCDSDTASVTGNERKPLTPGKDCFPHEQGGLSLHSNSDLRPWSLNEDEIDSCSAERTVSCNSVAPGRQKAGHHSIGVSESVLPSMCDSGSITPRTEELDYSGRGSSPENGLLLLSRREDSFGNARESSDMVTSVVDRKTHQALFNAQPQHSSSVGTTEPFSVSPRRVALRPPRITQQVCVSQIGSDKSSPQRLHTSSSRLSAHAGSVLFPVDDCPLDRLEEMEGRQAPADPLQCQVSPENRGLSDSTTDRMEPTAAAKPRSATMKSRRLNWVWNVGVSSADKATNAKTSNEVISHNRIGSSREPERTDVGSEVIRKPRWWHSRNDCSSFLVGDSAAEKASKIYDEEKSGKLATGSPDLLRRPKDKFNPVSPQALGQSLLEHLQVIEEAMSQASQAEHIHTGKKGHVAAMIALAEMRKIGNALQHA